MLLTPQKFKFGRGWVSDAELERIDDVNQNGFISNDFDYKQSDVTNIVLGRIVMITSDTLYGTNK